MNVKDLKTRTKVLIVSAGILGMAGLGVGAANAATVNHPVRHGRHPDPWRCR